MCQTARLDMVLLILPTLVLEKGKTHDSRVNVLRPVCSQWSCTSAPQTLFLGLNAAPATRFEASWTPA